MRFYSFSDFDPDTEKRMTDENYYENKKED
jgi:hypothetical protein